MSVVAVLALVGVVAFVVSFCCYRWWCYSLVISVSRSGGLGEMLPVFVCRTSDIKI